MGSQQISKSLTYTCVSLFNGIEILNENDLKVRPDFDDNDAKLHGPICNQVGVQYFLWDGRCMYTHKVAQKNLIQLA